MRTQLIIQFLRREFSFVFSWFAGRVCLWPSGLCRLMIQGTWLELNLSYTENVGFYCSWQALLFVTAIIAGSYPSFYITSFEPVSILKGKAKLGGTNWFTRILLGGQFVISLVSIIMGVAFYKNGNYQRDYDLGFATHGVISAWVNNEGAFNTYRDALASNEDIQEIAGTRHHVPFNFYNDPVKFGALEKEVDIMEVGDNYFEAMDMTLLSGRKFIKDSETDRKESVIITEELVKQFGWTDNPIGKRLVWMDTEAIICCGCCQECFCPRPLATDWIRS